MARATQKNRLLSITTPLGEDFLLINKFHAKESVSELFEIDVELLYDEEEDDAYNVTVVEDNEILGKTVSISIEQEDGGKRTMTGMVNDFTLIGRNRRFTFFYATIVPRVWKLTQIIQSRIFQHITVPDILKKVFAGYEVKYQFECDYKPRNYCVQYQESDFAFASRLMEEEGIFYYFEHTPQSEKLILRDTYKQPENCPNKYQIPLFDEDLNPGILLETAIKQWRADYKLRSGKQTFWDYHFQLPNKKLEAEKTSVFNAGSNQELEIYNFPAGYARKYDGIDKSGGERPSDLTNIFQDNKRTVKNRITALDSQVRTNSGISNCCTITSGYRFQLKNHPNKDFNKQYVILSATHEAEQTPSYIVGGVLPKAYENEFVCLPHGSGHPEFRPALKTPKPLVSGSQSAIVVGPAGEEIFTDKYGRVKVQFQWDRHGTNDADSSCWMRVIQPWAGGSHGVICIPRIGNEVIVEFMEGDPDQPIISGSVYNPLNMPPYTLPANAHTMGFKSNTTKGGSGYNEMAIVDDKANELVRIHAQKNMDTTVLNNDTQYVVVDRSIKVDGKQDETIKGNMSTTVSEGDQTNAVVAGSQSNTVKQDIVVKSESGQIYIEAATQITLKVGASSIFMNEAGIIEIAGTDIRLISKGPIASAATGDNSVKGANVLLNSD